MAKYNSAGTKVQVSTDSGVTYTDLYCQLSGFSGPSSTSGEIDVTSLCSTAKEYIGALPDNGNMSLTGYFDPADTGVDLLRTLQTARTVVDWKIIWPDTAATEWDFQGYVSEFGVSAEQDSALGMTATVRISGAVTES
jgi:hypothetical protein